MHISLEMTTCVCSQCGVLFALPAELDDNRQDDGKWFSCPNGHKQRYTSVDKRIEEATLREQKLQEDNQRLKDDLTQLAQKLEQAEAALEAKAPKRGRPRKTQDAK